jgi:hypothetical protein
VSLRDFYKDNKLVARTGQGRGVPGGGKLKAIEDGTGSCVKRSEGVG